MDGPDERVFDGFNIQYNMSCLTVLPKGDRFRLNF